MMNKYKDYPSYEQFLEHEFFPVRCAGFNHYWVSFKNGPSDSIGNDVWPYYANDFVYQGGGGFNKPKSIEWPQLSKYHYEQTHPILCYNKSSNAWAWFSVWCPFFDGLELAEPKKLVYRLIHDIQADSNQAWIGLVKNYWINTGWNLEPLYDCELYNLDNFEDSLFAEDGYTDIKDKTDVQQSAPLEGLDYNSIPSNVHITRVLVDVYFDKSDLQPPYGDEDGTYDCGTVQKIMLALSEAGYHADLLACVLNAATVPEKGVSAFSLHPNLRISKGEIDG